MRGSQAVDAIVAIGPNQEAGALRCLDQMSPQFRHKQVVPV